jgi:ABC-type sugar transport system ATPase subunit
MGTYRYDECRYADEEEDRKTQGITTIPQHKTICPALTGTEDLMIRDQANFHVSGDIWEKAIRNRLSYQPGIPKFSHE